jgi:VacB/RNase II family 3'-5' exoribonuclease
VTRAADIPILLRQTLEEFVRGFQCAEGSPGLWRVTGMVISEDDPRELLPFLEEVAEDAVGVSVYIDAPVVSPTVPDSVRDRVRRAAETPDDVVWIQADGKRLTLHVRHQDLLLGSRRNRLPKLNKALAAQGWRATAQPLGTSADVSALTKLPDTQAFLAQYVAAVGLDPSTIHEHKSVARRQELQVRVDAPDTPAAVLLRLARTVRDATDILLRIENRTSKTRARETVHSALAGLPYVERHQVRWVDKAGSVLAKVDAEQSHREALERFFARLEEDLGVPITFVFDTGNELMTDRLMKEFPKDGILTGIRHVDGTIYEVEAALPMTDPAELEDWSDRMEERWGVELLLNPPFLRAPDLRYRDILGADRETIALRYNRPGPFEQAIEDQARESARSWDLEAEIAAGTRRDIRSTVVMSIDPTRTKDLDDALSIDPAGEGVWDVGVHIADVAAFVPQGSALDAEALHRSFTTYLAEGEIPVLPSVLSDEVCSLHGGQDSPALSLRIRLTDAGEVLETDLGHTVIHNHCRLDYSGAQKVLDGADHPYADRLRTLDRLAKTLRVNRKEAGALDLSLGDDPEKPSHQLIEEFMLLANECVARFLKAEHPTGLCLYRTHPAVPDAVFASLRGIGEFLKCPIQVRDQSTMQTAMEHLIAREDPHAFQVFRFHVGRVLEKATYHFEQLGHGALAKQHYAHFTSPIRRYSDLIVHRLIDDALAWRKDSSGDPEAASSYRREGLYSVCDHLNMMEIRVDAGSFESHRLDDLRRFDRGGRSERGVIVGLMRGRVAIDLETTDLRVSVRYRTTHWNDVEMPVRVDDEITGMSLRLGAQVTVKTRGVDWSRKTIDALIVGD